MTPEGQANRVKINKQVYTKLKSFFTAKEIINKMKRQHVELEKMSENHTSDKRFISKIHKVFTQLNSKKKKKEIKSI